MESFFRYISYIDFYNNYNKIKNVGFLRWKFQNGKHNIEMQIKDVNNLYGNFKIEEKKSGKIIGNIKLDQGMGSYTKQFSVATTSDEIYLITEDGQIDIKEVEGFYIGLKDENYLFVPIKLPIENSQESSNSMITSEIESASDNALIEGIGEKYIPEDYIEITEENDNLKIIEPLHEDKWQQLSKKYSVVHPFPSKVSFLSIKPEDFIILQKEYQKLVHNSFLLHGFYNYGHLILGKLAEEENAPFYLGVPGVYYDREKQAAQMFGFVGFESTEQPVQVGSYGYYMIEVMI